MGSSASESELGVILCLLSFIGTSGVLAWLSMLCRRIVFFSVPFRFNISYTACRHSSLLFITGALLNNLPLIFISSFSALSCPLATLFPSGLFSSRFRTFSHSLKASCSFTLFTLPSNFHRYPSAISVRSSFFKTATSLFNRDLSSPEADLRRRPSFCRSKPRASFNEAWKEVMELVK